MWDGIRCGGFGVFLEREQGLGPEAIEVLLDDAKASWVQFVDTPGSLMIVSNQQRRFEHGEMLRHSRSGDVKLLCEFTNGQRPLQEKPRKNGAAGAVAKSVKLRVFVSSH